MLTQTLTELFAEEQNSIRFCYYHFHHWKYRRMSAPCSSKLYIFQARLLSTKMCIPSIILYLESSSENCCLTAERRSGSSCGRCAVRRTRRPRTNPRPSMFLWSGQLNPCIVYLGWKIWELFVHFSSCVQHGGFRPDLFGRRVQGELVMRRLVHFLNVRRRRDHNMPIARCLNHKRLPSSLSSH